MKYSVVHEPTGRIIRSNFSVENNINDIPEQLNLREVMIEGDYDSTVHYYDDGKIKDRPDCPAWIDKNKIEADGSDSIILSGVPDAAKVTIIGDRVAVMASDSHMEGDDIEITCDTAGIYRINILCWPEKDKILKFTVT